ncbi:MAG: penicillin-binding protein 2 [Acidimicrobiales bacterium]
MAGIARRRAGVMRVAIVVVFIALGLRLVAVQAFSSDHYAKIGASEVTSTVQVPAQRGGIFDRNGAVLAISVPRSDVVADPFLIRDPAGEARALAPVMGLTQPQLQAELSEHSGFVYLAQKVEQKVASQVKALDLVGITLLPDTERVDPAGQLATPLLGTVGSNGAGQAGLEYQFNKLLAGRNGSITEEQAPGGVLLLGGTTQRPAAKGGTGIELTIDQPLQYATEQSLGAAVTSSHAKSGIAVVMDTHTGDILAMANLVVDPKTRKLVEAGQNLALTQVYEPGSVFKAVTFSAALTDGIVAPSTVLTVPSSLTIDGWVFHDAENHPTEQLSATQILAQSSNIGTIEIAQALGKDRLAAQIGALGFGQPTGLGFPGESAGLVKKDASQWSASDIGSMPIGQDDAVTAQQVLDMINTVATGGVFVPPRLIRATVSSDGSVTATRSGAERRVLSPQVSSELTAMMEQVVQDGTAVSAGVPGYTVAGKTGTAQIPDPVHGGYIPGAYMATFAGFAPAQNPALSAIVVLAQPTPIFGGVVAAPVFSQVMQYALNRYGVPTSPQGTTGGTADPVPFSSAQP